MFHCIQQNKFDNNCQRPWLISYQTRTVDCYKISFYITAHMPTELLLIYVLHEPIVPDGAIR